MNAVLLIGACARAPLSAPLPARPEEAVYFVLVDRFHNGDPGNDGATDPADPAAFHGGDLAGILDRLDGIASLGTRTLWLSPIFRARDQDLEGHGAFHGYWTIDPGRIEPRFGTLREARALRRALSERGMRLVLDMVWNHVGYDAPILEQRPDWFHGHGDIVDWNDPVERVTHDVHGLPDLAQENEEVYTWIRDNALRWLRVLRPDGLRIDAVRHMPVPFQARLAADLRKEGGPDLWLLGEVYDGDPARLAEALRATGYSAVFDFPLHYAMVDAYCHGAGPGRLAAVLSQDRLYGDLLRHDPGTLATFLDNHDVPRILSACSGDAGKVAQALGFLLTARGTPVITWGTEAGLSGASDPDNRADMRFEPGHPLRGAIQALLALRAAHPVLSRGVTTFVQVGEQTLGMLRLLPSEAAVILVNFADGLLQALAVGPEEALPAVPAHSLAVAFYEAPQPGAWSEAAEAAWAPPARTVEVSASGAPLGEGDLLVLAGAGPELGHWDPVRAPRLPAGGEAAIGLPAGLVVAMKLAILRADGSVSWEHGPDRSVWVGEGGEALPLHLTWRPAPERIQPPAPPGGP